MLKFLILLVVLGVEVAAGRRYLHQTPPSPLLPNAPITQADPPILVYAPVAESREKLC